MNRGSLDKSEWAEDGDTMGITDQIREGCARVAAQARHVRIEEGRIAEYAMSLPLERAVAPTLGRATHYVKDEAGTAAFFVTLDAINFGSGYFPHLKKRTGMSGYFTVATSLKEEFERNGPMSAEVLAKITTERCREIFGQEAGSGPSMELMGLFATALRDLGQLLLARYAGRFKNLIESANASAERLVEVLAHMPFFRDVSSYHGMPTPFYKRAQLTAADLALALGGRGLGRFEDLHRLTIFADNLVPHVLRIDGILRYDPDLAQRIDREELIEAGSEQEVEVRACAVHAVELIKMALQGRKDVTSMGLDYVLWNRGQERHYKSVKPRHRARCVYY